MKDKETAKKTKFSKTQIEELRKKGKKSNLTDANALDYLKK